MLPHQPFRRFFLYRLFDWLEFFVIVIMILARLVISPPARTPLRGGGDEQDFTGPLVGPGVSKVRWLNEFFDCPPRL